jgi:hypothetical protein
LFGVDAFGSDVVIRQGQAGVDGVAVLVEAAGEGIEVGQVGRAGSSDPVMEAFVVAVTGFERAGEGAHAVCQVDHLGAGGSDRHAAAAGCR